MLQKVMLVRIILCKESGSTDDCIKYFIIRSRLQPKSDARTYVAMQVILSRSIVTLRNCAWLCNQPYNHFIWNVKSFAVRISLVFILKLHLILAGLQLS